jgi:hypothetical protein
MIRTSYWSIIYFENGPKKPANNSKEKGEWDNTYERKIKTSKTTNSHNKQQIEVIDFHVEG